MLRFIYRVVVRNIFLLILFIIIRHYSFACKLFVIYLYEILYIVLIKLATKQTHCMFKDAIAHNIEKEKAMVG